MLNFITSLRRAKLIISSLVVLLLVCFVTTQNVAASKGNTAKAKKVLKEKPFVEENDPPAGIGVSSNKAGLALERFNATSTPAGWTRVQPTGSFTNLLSFAGNGSQGYGVPGTMNAARLRASSVFNGATAGVEGSLATPALTGLNAGDEFSFEWAYWGASADGITDGTLYLKVLLSLDGGTTYPTTLLDVAGAAAYSKPGIYPNDFTYTTRFQDWDTYKFVLDNSVVGATVKFKFVYGTGATPSANGQGFIDNVYAGPPQTELAVDACSVPAPYLGGGSTVAKAWVRWNASSTPPATIDLTYKLDGMPADASDGTTNTLTPNWPVVANKASEVEVTFTTPVTLPTVNGSHTLNVKSFLVGDADVNNDYRTFNFPVQPQVSALPYFDNFDAADDGSWGTVNSGSSWLRKTPAVAASGDAQVNNPYSAPNVWIIGDNGFYANGALSYLYSPYISIAALSPKAFLSFHHNFVTETDWDGLVIEISVDGGAWSRLLDDGFAYNWYNNSSADLVFGPPAFSGTSKSLADADQITGWAFSKIHIPEGLTGNVFQLRWFFESDGSVNDDGYAIDDVTIAPPPLAAAFNLTNPANNTNPAPLSPGLAWEVSDFSFGYDLYLSTTTPPALFEQNIQSNSYQAMNLAPLTQYYWNVVAHNEAGTPTNSSNGPFTFTTGLPPNAPTDLLFSNVTQTSVDLAWTDNSANEDGFHVYRSATGVPGSYIPVGGDIVGTSFSDVGPLVPAAKYYYDVRAFNAQGESDPASGTIGTLPAPPAASTFGATGYHEIIVNPSHGSNDPSAELAIQVEGSIFGKSVFYVQADGSLGASEDWHTSAMWNGQGGAGTNVITLYPGTQYTFRTKARNADNIESAFGADANANTVPALDVEATPMFEPFGAGVPLAVFPPPGWKVIDANNDAYGTDLLFTQYGSWHRSNTNLYSAGSAARYFTYDYPNAVNAPVYLDALGNPVDSPGDDYIVTIPVALNAGTRYNCTFYYRTVPGAGHDMSVLLMTGQRVDAITEVLFDGYFDTPGGYFQTGVNFAPPSTGTYYIGWYDHSPTNQVTIRIEDVRIEKAPEYDLLGEKIKQSNRYPESYDDYKMASKKIVVNDDIEASNQRVLSGVTSGTAKSAGKLTSTHPFKGMPKSMNVAPINFSLKGNANSFFGTSSPNSDFYMKNIGQNGVTGGQWAVDWITSSTSQPQVPGVDVAAGGNGIVNLSFSPADVGTFWTVANTSLAGDGNAANDTVKDWTYAYTSNPFAIDYDSTGYEGPPFRNSVGTNVPFTAAMRYTVPDGKFLHLSSMYTYYKTTQANNLTPVNTPLAIQVWGIAVDGNGDPDYETVGPLLFTKFVGGNDYLANISGFGNPFNIPLTDADMSFGPGDEFILSITFDALSNAPIGYVQFDTADGHNLRPEARSYYSTDAGVTWTLMTSSEDWVIKAISEKLNNVTATLVEDDDGDLNTTNDQTPVAGATVKLYDDVGAVIGTEVTDADGKVLFSPLVYNIPDGDYTVTVTEDAGAVYLNPTSVGVNVAAGAVGGNDNGHADFALFYKGSISGNASRDVDGSGTKDVGEPNLADWEVLLMVGTTQVGNATTDANGDFIFEGLGPATYTVGQTLPYGWASSFSADDIALTSGAEKTGKDVGAYETGTITGTVFDDLDASGTKDVGEPGIANWELELSESLKDPVSGQTDENGLYAFGDIAPGDYDVDQVVGVGYTQSMPATGGYTGIAIDGFGTDDTGNDFGNFKMAQITGLVYLDSNQNATQDVNEPALSGWEVKIGATADVTDESGYGFELTPGIYSSALTVQSGWVQTSPASGGITDTVSSGEVNSGNNYGVFQYGTVNVLVYNDANKNGTQDEGETGAAGWVVSIASVGADTTDANGAASFGNLNYGSYTVTIAAQAGYNISDGEDGKSASVTTGSTSSLKFGTYADTYKFRTFKEATTLSAKIVKMKYANKAGVITLTGTPNEVTVVENVFKQAIGKSGTTFLGIPQNDKTLAKSYGWLFYKGSSALGKMFTEGHTQKPFPIDSLRITGKKSKKLAKAIAAARKTYNNPAWAQGILLRLNIIASDTGITPKGFGDLVIDTVGSLAGTSVNGMTVRDMAKLYDTCMTYYESKGINNDLALTDLAQFVDKILTPLNSRFYQAMTTATVDYVFDTTAMGPPLKNPYAVNLLGYKTASEAGGIVKNVGKISGEQFVPITGYQDAMPTQFELNQNYPNPFNPSTVISVGIPEELDGAIATLKVYNVLGQEVATIANNEELTSGVNEFSFDATKLSSGVYFYRVTLNGGEFTAMKKMMLLK